MYELTRADNPAAGVRDFTTMAAAMTGAGHPDPAAWYVTGIPSQIYTACADECDPAAAADPACQDRHWVITADAAARELIAMMPAGPLSGVDHIVGVWRHLRYRLTGTYPRALCGAQIAERPDLSPSLPVCGECARRDPAAAAKAVRMGAPGIAGSRWSGDVPRPGLV